MIVDRTNGYLDEVKAEAKKLGKLEQLNDRLDYLHTYANKDDHGEMEEHRTRCLLFKDFAPLSFEFVIQEKKEDGDWATWFNGGLIFHGEHDNGGDGGPPTLSVNLNPVDGWSIHT